MDRVESKMQVVIKRPENYLRGVEKTARELPHEVLPVELIDSQLQYRNKRNVIRMYCCKVVEDAAQQCEVGAL